MSCGWKPYNRINIYNEKEVMADADKFSGTGPVTVNVVTGGNIYSHLLISDLLPPELNPDLRRASN